jgi:hypothetical protein
LLARHGDLAEKELAMPENHNGASQPSVAMLVGGIFVDAQKLVRQEITLARCEVAEKCEKAKTGVALLSGALTVCGVGGVLLGLMLVKLLHQFLLPNYEWACFGIVGSLFAVIGGGVACFGFEKIKQVKLWLPQTAESLRDDAQAVGGAVSECQSAAGILLKR